jgi:hypothetical protein
MPNEFIIPRPNATNGRNAPRRPEYNTHISCPTPSYSSYSLWRHAYHKELFDLYQIYNDKINEYYPENTIIWDDIKMYNNFCVFIYHHSSKYIVNPEYNTGE